MKNDLFVHPKPDFPDEADLMDPTNVDFVIPANDDASKSIELILDTVCAAINEGLEERKVEKVDSKDAEGETEAAPRRERRRVSRGAKAEEAPKAAEAPAEEAPKAEETAE